MTKRDEVVFAKAFAKMKAKGYFDEPQAKDKDETESVVKDGPVVIKVGKKPRKKAPVSVSSQNVAADKVTLAASKK